MGGPGGSRAAAGPSFSGGLSRGRGSGAAAIAGTSAGTSTTLGVNTNYDPAWVMMGGRADGAAVGVLRGAWDNGGGEKVTTVSVALQLRERRRAEDQEQSAGRYSKVLTEEAKRRGGSGGGLLDGLGGCFLGALTFATRGVGEEGGGGSSGPFSTTRPTARRGVGGGSGGR